MINDNLIVQYHQNGYVIVPALFSSEEVEHYKQHYMALNARANKSFGDDTTVRGDPLLKYPRILNPHRVDSVSREWLLDPRLDEWMTALLGDSPFAVQTMFYFKPAGARGQALHQDQFYTRVQPGTCMAAWMAVDRCDEENGCLQIVPHTSDLPTLCSVPADTTQSFTPDTVILPDDMSSMPIIMEPGDVLLFNGQVIHGSYPNRSKDRFRRALIGHYIVAEAQKVATWFHPVLRMDGTVVELETSELGGRCGVWVDEDGVPVAKMEGMETRQGASAANYL